MLDNMITRNQEWPASEVCPGDDRDWTFWCKSTASASSNCVEVRWRKATDCNNGSCVEVGVCAHDGTVQVRDSKHRDGPVLTFTAAEWQAFLVGAKAGEFG